MAAASLLQAAIGLLTLIGLGFTVWYARQTWKEARRSAVAAVEAAQEAEGATKVALDALQAARDTAKRQLRAYIGVHSTKIIQFHPGMPLAIALVFKNEGQTPASKCQSRFTLTMEGELLSEKAFVGDGDLLNPGGEHNVVAATATILGLDRHGWLHRAEKVLLFEGEYRYADVYGEQHTTVFSYELLGKGLDCRPSACGNYEK